MMSPNRAAIPFLRLAALLFFFTTPAISQIRQIDRTKLPQNAAVQSAYSDLLPIDQFARTSEANWRYPIPKEQVSSRFRKALHTLEQAQEQTPDNKELQLLTGLVAHLASNLGIEEAYDLALTYLQPQAKDDFRAAWFLGIHECQSNFSVAGMQQLLRVEASTKSLPASFWQDYANCANTTNMPVHAIRAYDNARKSPDGLPVNEQNNQLEQIARNRIKPSSDTASYPPKEAWHPEKTVGGVRFTSSVCGQSFLTRATSIVKLGDTVNGMCLVTINSEQYPSRYGPSSASILLLTQSARPGESLEAFSQRVLEAQQLLKDPHHPEKASITGVPCPVANCLSFDIVSDKLYKAEGGAHVLAVFFQSDQPSYPGLRLETPQPMPKVSSTSGQPVTPEPTLQRFNGTLYTFVSLDANHDIYPRSRADLDDLLKSLIVDSK